MRCALHEQNRRHFTVTVRSLDKERFDFLAKQTVRGSVSCVQLKWDSYLYCHYFRCPLKHFSIDLNFDGLSVHMHYAHEPAIRSAIETAGRNPYPSKGELRRCANAIAAN